MTSVYTKAGMALLLDAVAGTRLTITKAVGGTGIIDDSLLSQQTDVSGDTHPLQLLGIRAEGTGEDAVRRVPVRITGAETAYVLHQIGIYGRQDDGDDTLLMLIQDERGFDIPSADSGDFEFVFSALIAISASAKITVELTAEMRGLQAWLRQEIHDHTAHVSIVDITIPASAWAVDTQTEYNYVADIQIAGVTSEQSPTVTIHKECSTTARKAALCAEAETLDSGVLRLWAQHIPTADMIATVQLVAPKAMGDWEQPDEPTGSATSLLGDAICGNAICGM